jgi:DNA-directed RNA polymerase specialized sigma24 family protein
VVSKSDRRLAELELLYRERFPAFARVAISVTGSVELGRDAVQEAFARAIEQRARFRGDCPLEAWLWRIVVNTAQTASRRASYETGELTIAPEAATNG